MVLQIFIDYRMNNSSQWQTVEFSPEEYFDISLDENIEWNSVPEYNHAIEYLNIDTKLVVNTRIRINDSNFGDMTTITTTFWNQGKNFVLERTDKETKVSSYYCLLITNILLQEDPSISEIMRFKKIDGVLEIEFHSFIQDNEDGSQTEKIVFPAN